MRKKIGMVLIVAIILVSIIPISATAAVSVDDYLISIGVPSNVVSSMPVGQKEMIYASRNSAELSYAGYTVKEFCLSDDNRLIEKSMLDIAAERISNIKERFKIGGTYSIGGLVPSSDLTISVLGVKARVSSGGNVWTEYAVYPSFVWHKLVKISNDSFAMSMYPGWEAVPGSRNLRIHLLNTNGTSVHQVDLDPSDSNDSGYVYRIPSNIGALQGSYQGYAVYYLEKKDANASPRISICYVHDKSLLHNISFGITLGIGSISVSATSDNIDTMSDNFEVSGLQ